MMNASAGQSGGGFGGDREFDVIVLGAGPVGQNVAARTRAAGLSVAVVERELVGGSARTGVASQAESRCSRPVIAVGGCAT